MGRGRGAAAMYGIHPPPPPPPPPRPPPPLFCPCFCRGEAWRRGWPFLSSCDGSRSWISLHSLGCLRAATDGPTFKPLKLSNISLSALGWPFLYCETRTKLLTPGVVWSVSHHALPVVVPAPCAEPRSSGPGREGPGVPTVRWEGPRPRYQWQELQESLEERQHGVPVLPRAHTRQQGAAEATPDDRAGAGGKVWGWTQEER